MAVSANHFFIVIALLLAAILLFFQPMDLKKRTFGDLEVAELELHNFTLYELDANGLENIMIGRKGIRYGDRIEVVDIDYTDSSQALQNNLQADYGIYNNKDLITLKGNVRYYREDGMQFRSDEAIINQTEQTIATVGPFKMDKFTDNVVGNDLFYDTKNGVTKAKEVTGFFTLPE